METGKLCVITLGISGPSPAGFPKAVEQSFQKGIKALRARLKEISFSGDFIFWDKEYPEGSPTHAESPFAFKPFCFLAAAKLGYSQILWLDSSVYPKQPLEPLFKTIKERGYLFFRESHSVGEFCKDDALAPLGISREESFKLPSCKGSVIGLDLDSPKAADFLQEWARLARDGTTFPGPKWSGVRGFPTTASADPRVKGHRHDQTAASVLALRRGMDQWLPKSEFDAYFENRRDSVRKFEE